MMDILNIVPDIVISTKILLIKRCKDMTIQELNEVGI